MPGAVSVPRTTFEIKRLFTRLKSSPVRCPCSIGKKKLSTLASTKCVDRTWEALKHSLPAQKEVDERSTHKVPLSLFHTKSRRGLGVRIWPTWPQRFLCGSSPNLVKTALVYPHFAEEKKQSFCGYSTKTRQKSQWNCDDFSTSTTTASPHCSLYGLWGLWSTSSMWAFSTLDSPPSWSWMCPAGRSPVLWFLHWPHQGVQQHPSATHLWVGCTPWGLLTCFGALECFFDYLHQILWTPGCPEWKYHFYMWPCGRGCT